MFWVKTRADEVDTSEGGGVKKPGFFRLPYELRNQIYNLVFEGNKCTPAYRFADRHKVRQVMPRNFVALLLVCRSIYKEARLLPFILTTFEFYDAVSHYHFVDLLFRYQREAMEHVKMIAERASIGQHDYDSFQWSLQSECWFSEFNIDQVYEELVNMFPNLRTLTVEQHMVNRKSLEDVDDWTHWHLKALPAMFDMHHQESEARFESILKICYCDAEEPVVEGCDLQRTSPYAIKGHYVIRD